jgi:hypothetical protein
MKQSLRPTRGREIRTVAAEATWRPAAPPASLVGQPFANLRGHLAFNTLRAGDSHVLDLTPLSTAFAFMARPRDR